MEPHQKRVVEEKKELDDKLDKLISFIGGSVFPDLVEAERQCLERQMTYMELYSRVLAERIAAFSP